MTAPNKMYREINRQNCKDMARAKGGDTSETKGGGGRPRLSSRAQFHRPGHELIDCRVSKPCPPRHHP